MLLIAGIAGVLAVIPMMLDLLQSQPDLLKGQALPLPLPLLLLISVIQNALLLGLVVGVGLVLARKVGLGAPLLERWLAGEKVTHEMRATLPFSFLVGIGVGAVCLLFLFFVFLPLVPVQPFTLVAKFAVWKRFGACFYGGITEELLMRLFLFSFLVWLLSKIFRRETGKAGAGVLWTVNITVAIIFGLGHLPSASFMMQITPAAVVEALLLNGIAGVTFGYLYWKRGLESAITAHFAADLMLFVIGPVFLPS